MLQIFLKKEEEETEIQLLVLKGVPQNPGNLNRTLVSLLYLNSMMVEFHYERRNYLCSTPVCYIWYNGYLI